MKLFTQRLLLSVMLVGAFGASSQAELILPEIMQQGDIIYVSGGIGNGEREALAMVKKNYNLHILSAESNGAFVGNTHLLVKNHDGEEVLSSDAGPVFYAQVPAGKYTVIGKRHDETKKQTITINPEVTKTVTFIWKPITD